MNGSNELAQLAHLLRACSETARNIAWLRPKDAHLLLPISRQANDMAGDVDLIISPQDVRRR